MPSRSVSPNTAYGTKKLNWDERIVAKVLPMYETEGMAGPDDVVCMFIFMYIQTNMIFKK